MFASRAWVSDEGGGHGFTLERSNEDVAGAGSPCAARASRRAAARTIRRASSCSTWFPPTSLQGGRKMPMPLRASAWRVFPQRVRTAWWTDGMCWQRRASPGLFSAGESRERVTDWLCAMAVAREAVSIQEVLNKTKPLVPALMPVEKRVARNARTGTCFRIFSIAFDLGPDGESALRADDAAASLPEEVSAALRSITRSPPARSRTAGPRCCFSFFRSKTRSRCPISRRRFAISVGEEVVGQALQALAGYEGGFAEGSGGPGSLDLLSETGNLLVSDERIVEEDFPCVQRLMYALVSLHLEGARASTFSQRRAMATS